MRGGAIQCLSERGVAVRYLPMAASHRFQPQPEAGSDRWSPGPTTRACDQHLGRAERACKIMRGKANARFQAGQPQLSPNPWGEPGVGGGQARPCAFIEAA